jgi:outer membrane protein assembly factor BamD (BamD/ComL family)
MTCALLALIFTVAKALAQDPPPGTAQMEFDLRTGQWNEIPAPQPGTPEGELALIRGQLASSEYGRAVKSARRWLQHYGTSHALSREVRVCLAEGLLSQGDHYKAHEVCSEVLAQGSGDPSGASAAEMEFIIADAFLSGTRRKWMGMPLLSGQELAITILDGLSHLHNPPRIAEYALKRKGDYYFDRAEFDLADDEYAKLLAGFPASPYVPWLTLRRAQAALARFPGIRFDDAALVEAEERFLRYRQQYPARAEAENVDLILEDIRNTRAQKEYDIGLWYDKVGKPQAAQFYYRSVVDNWPGTLAASQAQGRIAGSPRPEVQDDPAPETGSVR